MSEQKYIGITIGPTYKTLSKGEKTREIWGGSYVLSYLCRKLLHNLKIPVLDILLPIEISSGVSKPGVGLFPDRILFKAGNYSIEGINKIIVQTKKDLVKEILDAIKKYNAYDPYAKLFKEEVKNTNRQSEVEQHLFDFFQVYAIECTENDLMLKDDEDQPLGVVKNLGFYLDNLELRQSITGFDPDPLKVFLRGINHSFLLKDAFANGFTHFPSLVEIATTELRFISTDKVSPTFRESYDKKVEASLNLAINEEKVSTNIEANREDDESDESNEDKANDNLLEELFSFDGIDEYLRTYHKYVAIIHADGDRMGTLLGKLSAGEVPGFSKDLMKFAIEANKIIAGARFTQNDSDKWGYGGAPVYIGGDDLVFFAPVASLYQNEIHSRPIIV